MTLCSYYNSCFLKKHRSNRNSSGIRLHDGDLEHSLMTSLFTFLCSGILDLALGILMLLIRVCFWDALQPAVY